MKVERDTPALRLGGWKRVERLMPKSTQSEMERERSPLVARSSVKIGKLQHARPCSGPQRPGTGRVPASRQRALDILPYALLLLLLIASAAHAADTTVSMVNFQFSPKDITVNAGDTVTWVNQDFTFHDSTSGTNGVPSGLWHSPLFGNGASFSFTFNVPAGYYGYYFT